MKKLYHYVHCPYCIRVRMGFGLLGIPFESHVLPYNDEQTPLHLTGVKMLPIMVDEMGVAMNESLDILKRIDEKQVLRFDLIAPKADGLESFLDRVASPVHNLCMPYWIWTPEFDSESRSYFENKKSKKRGPFNLLALRKDEFLKQLPPLMEELSSHLSPYYCGSEFSIADIMVAAHLWGLYIFPEYQFPSQIHDYLQDVKKRTHFNYHEDFWR